ncbi:hypothetical protein AWE51_09465 [Aquimarina aggregata]|uniref:HTH araC/xylS-type domain-containing protein n=2 Tax=Aquimarina aggregata TaxID=1642818 RepID=A0A162ZKR2_9FLAO|nr:hypothetical protein AWE51_09465 [Aquimarina aggregata]
MHARQLILFLFLCSCLGYGQSFKIPDSLASLSYEELSNKFYKELRANKELTMLYAKTYLQKAKNDKDSIEISIGYSFVGFTFDEKTHHIQQLTYLDSAIAVCKKTNNNRYPLLHYISKAAIYEEKGSFKQALNNYLIAIELAKKSQNNHLEFITKDNIALLKRKLGKYKEAKAIYRQSLYYRINKEKMTRKDSLNYFLTLSDLVNIYRLENQIDSARVLNKKGIIAIKNEKIVQKGLNLDLLFKFNETLLGYYDGEYIRVIKSTKKLLSELLKPKNRYFFYTEDLINAYLYIGKSYEALDNQEKAIIYYQKIDSIAETDYILPQTVSAYKSLISHYKSLGDKDQQLFYLNKLLRSDSILHSNYRDLSNKLVKEYDTPNLLKEKKQLIASLKGEKKESSNQVILVSLFLALSLGGTGYYYYKQQRYKQRFKQLVAANARQESTKKKSPKNAIGIDAISKETLESLLAHLQKFEENKGYLTPKINAKDLAKQFGSNSSYLSVVVNTYKQKSLSQYISDLRIDYAVKKLQEDPKFRKYTIKAIAQEVGFNTAEAFAKAFYKKTGIYPSYFIKKLGFHDNA